MKTKFIITIIITLHLSLVFCQNEKYLTLELGGVGGLGSFNYESVFNSKEKMRFSFRTGFSVMPIDKNNGTALIFPQMVQGTYGQNSLRMFLGIGISPSITTNFGGAYVRMPLAFGSSLEPSKKKYFVRIAYTPLVSFLFDLQWEHWAGITCGYKLNSKKVSK